jgi:hypothetical protein
MARFILCLLVSIDICMPHTASAWSIPGVLCDALIIWWLTNPHPARPSDAGGV